MTDMPRLPVRQQTHTRKRAQTLALSSAKLTIQAPPEVSQVKASDCCFHHQRSLRGLAQDIKLECRSPLASFLLHSSRQRHSHLFTSPVYFARDTPSPLSPCHFVCRQQLGIQHPTMRFTAFALAAISTFLSVAALGTGPRGLSDNPAHAFEKRQGVVAVACANVDVNVPRTVNGLCSLAALSGSCNNPLTATTTRTTLGLLITALQVAPNPIVK